MLLAQLDSALLNYLFRAETRPGMYFGSHRVEDVKRHLDGWRAHRDFFRDGDAFAYHFFSKFHAFVEDHYGDARTLGWQGLISENASSEEEGFQRFMALVRQFAEEFADTHGPRAE